MIQLLLITTIVVDFLIAVLILKNNSKSLQNRFFAALLFAISLWAAGDSLMLFADQPPLTAFGAYLFIIAPLYTTLFVLLFARAFPRDTSVNRTALVVAPPAVIFSLAAFYNLGNFIQTIDIQNPQNRLTVAQPGYFLYSLYFGIYLVYALWLLAKGYRHYQGHERVQLGYTFLAIAISSSTSMVTNLTLPNLGTMSYVWAGAFSTVVAAAIISVAIVKHRLFDIRLVVARSLAYVLLVSALVSIYTLIVFVVTVRVFGTDSNLSQRVIPIVAAIFLAFTSSRLKKFFDRVTNKYFYRDAYDPQGFLDDLNKVLVSTIDTDRLLKGTVDVIDAHLKPAFAVFLLKETITTKKRVIGNAHAAFNDEDIARIRHLVLAFGQKVVVTDDLEETRKDFYQALNRNDIGIVVQLASNISSRKEGVGYLLLGIKKSGNIYNRQDIRMLEIVANELVIAIQNALRFEEIENFNITLQEKVDDATRRLRQTNEKLRQLDETKDEFISMASHQLRTPLTSMKGYVSMVLEGDAGKITSMQRKLLDQAFVSSQRMVYLIADLLNVSRLKTGKFIIEAVPTNLADVIEGEISQLKETAKSRGLTLTYEKPDNFPVLMLDETKIRQVIMNFIDNAIYYTPSGGHIAVTLEDKDNAVEYKVTDDGIGVPKHEQHHLFGKFYRAGNAKKVRPDGTGLGLFMAKKVIVAQGGGLIFSSQEGKGSTFGFSFPKAKQPTPPTP